MRLWERQTTRLGLLALAAALPLFAALLFLLYLERREELGRAVEQHRLTARLGAARVGGTIAGASRLISTLSHAPVFSEGDREKCARVLREVLADHPGYLDIAIVGSSAVFCRAKPEEEPLGMPQSWVAQARTTGSIVVSDPFVTASGRLAIAVAAPLSNRFINAGVAPADRRIIVTELDVQSIAASLGAGALPPGRTFSLLDREHRVIAAFPEGTGSVGLKIPLPSVPQTTEPVVMSHGDGPMLVAAVPESDNGPSGYHVVLGVSGDLALGASNARWSLFVLLTALAVLGALGLGGMAARRLIVKPSRQLARVARRLAEGDYSARADLSAAGVGMGGLAETVNELAAALERRHAEVDEVSGHLRTSEEKYRGLFEALAETEERMRFALGVARVGVWETNFVTGHSYWSETCEIMHGLAPGSYGGDDAAYMRAIHPDDREGVRAAIVRAIETRGDAAFEYRPAALPNRWIRSLGRFTLDRDGVPVRGAGIVQDVTERLEIEERLRQSQKMEAIGQLAGGVAHDFNNLLTVIGGNAELARAGVTDESVRADLSQVIEAVRRAAEMTRQLLAFSRKQVLHVEAVNVDEMARSLMPMLGRLIETNIELQYVGCCPESTVIADRVQLEHAVMNLVVNARDAMEDGGRIRLIVAPGNNGWRAEGAGAPRNYLTLTVEDNGAGMTPEVQARAFEPFFTTKPAGKGTGLGLASVYGTVKQSGGDVKIVSTPGEGTRVTLILPLATGAVANDPSPATHEAERPGAKATVLVVEDLEPVRRFAARVLREAGYTVLEADRADRATRIVETHPEDIDLVVSDVMMPGPSIVDALEEIRSRHPGIAVLMTSGYSDSDARRRLGELDTVILPKPFGAADLLDHVAAALRRSRPA